MSKSILIFVSLLMLRFVRCEVHTQKASDKSSDKERGIGTLMSVDDCFNLYVYKGLIVYDGSETALSNFRASSGHCIKPHENGTIEDEGKPQTASITFRADSEASNFKQLEIKIQTVHDLRAQYWSISEIMVMIGKEQTPLKIDQHLHTASDGFSFSCRNLMLKRQDDSLIKKLAKITLIDFQIQPFKGAIFEESLNCATWFTIGTFCGLLILIFFTSILAFGILYIMNIKSNDRFEDPKGKPLQLGNTDN